MGGLTKPSTKLVNLPAPGQMYPGISQQYQGMLQTMGPQFGQTLGDVMKTGMPTDVGPAFNAFLDARKRSTDQGRGNIIEAFGAQGARYGSSAMNGLVDYELQSQKDTGQMLADWTRQSSEAAAGRRMQALGLGGSMYQDAATTTYPTAALATGASPMSQIAQAGGSSLAMLVALGLI